MINQDVYSTALNKILNGLENTYGLKEYNTDQTRLLCDLDITDCLFNLKNELSSVNSKMRDDRNKKALADIVHLSYISSRMKYYKKIRLDYSKYPNMGKIASILLLFTGRIKSSDDMKKINAIIIVLSQIDKKTAKARHAIGYRFLRIFIVILLNGGTAHASVVADFILNQFITN